MSRFCISHLELFQHLLQVIDLVDSNIKTLSLDSHAQELLDLTQVTAFSFVHEESFFLIDKFFILAEEHSIININNSHNQFGAFLAHEDPGI
jgi:hypothetical protein